MVMDEYLIQVGLPVKCRKCRTEGRVKPATDYSGWYKSRVLRMRLNKWFCPEHAEIGKNMDDHFYQRYATPAPVDTPETTVDELYKLLD
jgi:hypothetical protein